MTLRESRRKPEGRLQKIRRPNNGLQAGILAYLTTSTHILLDIRVLPKKYSVCPPLLIIPVNFSSNTLEWQAKYGSLSSNEKHNLFASIASAFKAQAITHIAINAAISASSEQDGTQNVIRRPSSITPVYGDFGPRSLLNPEQNNGQPAPEDLDAAFWVSTTQNSGIFQTWAPLWTMFSRGNITEKARILGDGNGMLGLTGDELGEDLSGVDVADFYVGIGYFAFSYLKRGARTVYGWDINGWSIEGLRRGCEKNGWACLVVKINQTGLIEDGGLDKIGNFLSHPWQGCVAFLGDNKWADIVLNAVQTKCEESGLPGLNIRHVNLGLLPSSIGSRPSAVRVLRRTTVSWIHAHENVDIGNIETKRIGMIHDFHQLILLIHRSAWEVSCSHVEQVKTYAPGVMHCVFDIEARPI